MILEVQYRQAFLKDLKQLKSSTSYQRIYEVAFTTLAVINTLEEIPDIKAMKGYSGRYRIRIEDTLSVISPCSAFCKNLADRSARSRGSLVMNLNKILASTQ